MSVHTEVAGAAQPVVALTFDDGPGPYTNHVLEILDHYQVRATFFVCGVNIRRHPETLRRVVAAGHLLGNHTFHHPQSVAGSRPFGDFDQLEPGIQARELDRTDAQIRRVLGSNLLVRMMRGPGGSHDSPALAALAAERGLAIIGWSVDTDDWRQPSVADLAVQDRIVERATSGTVLRPIVLMHDSKASAEPEAVVSASRANTVAALPRIIEHYRRTGHSFVAPDGLEWPS